MYRKTRAAILFGSRRRPQAPRALLPTKEKDGSKTLFNMFIHFRCYINSTQSMMREAASCPMQGVPLSPMESEDGKN